MWNHIFGKSEFVKPGFNFHYLYFQPEANHFSPAVVSHTAQYELFFPREMLLWHFSMPLFVYKT